MNVPVEVMRRWLRSTTAFMRENFHAEPDAWQSDVFDAWDDPKQTRIAMQACAGPGKSAAEAICAWKFLSCYATEHAHPNAYAVSITADNLKDGFWKEMAVWYNRSEFLKSQFVIEGEQIFHRQHPKTWWLRARAFRQTADAEAKGRTLSGLHAPYIAYFLDETGDMPVQLLRTASQGLTNCQWGKILIGGNPTSHDGALYHAVNNESHRWSVFRVTGDPDDPKRSPRIDLEEARQNIALYGRTNPWVMAYVLGQFPPSAINALLSTDDVRGAMERELPAHAYANVAMHLGIDVARFGDDRTVIFPRQGRRALAPIILRNADTLTIAGRVVVEKQKWESEHEMIDNSGGWAAGVIDQCRIGGHTLYPVDSSAPANDPRYFNRRSELKFLSAEWVKTGGWLPNLADLVREFTAETYWFEGGKLRVEEKKLVKKRLGFSPDLKDAFDYSFALPDSPKRSREMLAGFVAGRGQSLHEYNPLEAVA